MSHLSRIPVPVVLGALVLAGCASTKPPSQPVEARAYEATWAVVPLLPPADAVESVHWERHTRMVEELTATLSAYGQSFTVYGQGDTTGITPDSLYQAAEEREGRTLDASVLRHIRDETGARYLLIARADQWQTTSGGVEPFLGLSPSGGIAVGIVRRVGGNTKVAPITAAALVDASSTGVLWKGARVAPSTTPSEPVVDAALTTRSLVVEVMTGRALPAIDYQLDASGTLLVYRYEKSALVARSARSEGTEVVIETKEGATKRLPIHTVSKIKATDRNETLFPHKDPNVIRPDAFEE